VGVVRYFAYGSNMNEEDLARWCRKKGYEPVRPLRREVAVLRGWRLVFNYYSHSRKGGAANIEPREGCEVWGVLMELSEEDYEKIRKKEGAPRCYEEITVTVVTRDGRVVDGVKTFRVARGRESGGFVPPTREYLNLIVEAAERYQFPKWYIDELRSVRTMD